MDDLTARVPEWETWLDSVLDFSNIDPDQTSVWGIEVPESVNARRFARSREAADIQAGQLGIDATPEPVFDDGLDFVIEGEEAIDVIEARDEQLAEYLSRLDEATIAPGHPTMEKSDRNVVDALASLAAEDTQSDIRERVFVGTQSGAMTFNVDGGEHSVVVDGIVSRDRFERTLSSLSPDQIRRLSASSLRSGDGDVTTEEIIEEQEAAIQRRELRDSLDDSLKAHDDLDPDDWNTDARADGTAILQNPETGETDRIEPDGDVAATVDTFGGSDSSESGASPEPVPTTPDGFELDERAVAAVVVAVVAIAYGVIR